MKSVEPIPSKEADFVLSQTTLIVLNSVYTGWATAMVALALYVWTNYRDYICKKPQLSLFYLLIIVGNWFAVIWMWVDLASIEISLKMDACIYLMREFCSTTMMLCQLFVIVELTFFLSVHAQLLNGKLRIFEAKHAIEKKNSMIHMVFTAVVCFLILILICSIAMVATTDSVEGKSFLQLVADYSYSLCVSNTLICIFQIVAHFLLQLSIRRHKEQRLGNRSTRTQHFFFALNINTVFVTAFDWLNILVGEQIYTANDKLWLQIERSVEPYFCFGIVTTLFVLINFYNFRKENRELKRIRASQPHSVMSPTSSQLRVDEHHSLQKLSLYSGQSQSEKLGHQQLVLDSDVAQRERNFTLYTNPTKSKTMVVQQLIRSGSFQSFSMMGVFRITDLKEQSKSQLTDQFNAPSD